MSRPAFHPGDHIRLKPDVHPRPEKETIRVLRVARNKDMLSGWGLLLDAKCPCCDVPAFWVCSSLADPIIN